jgi:hypothetical protein
LEAIDGAGLSLLFLLPVFHFALLYQSSSMTKNDLVLRAMRDLTQEALVEKVRRRL